jgi:hypothetical protein
MLEGTLLTAKHPALVLFSARLVTESWLVKLLQGLAQPIKLSQEESTAHRSDRFLGSPSVGNEISLSYRKSPHTLNFLNRSLTGPITEADLPKL